MDKDREITPGGSENPEEYAQKVAEILSSPDVPEGEKRILRGVIDTFKTGEQPEDKIPRPEKVETQAVEGELPASDVAAKTRRVLDPTSSISVRGYGKDDLLSRRVLVDPTSPPAERNSDELGPLFPAEKTIEELLTTDRSKWIELSNTFFAIPSTDVPGYWLIPNWIVPPESKYLPQKPLSEISAQSLTDYRIQYAFPGLDEVKNTDTLANWEFIEPAWIRSSVVQFCSEKYGTDPNIPDLRNLESYIGIQGMQGKARRKA